MDSRSVRSAVFSATIVLAAVSVASSMPILMDRYNAHPQTRPELRDQCVICHVYEDGSGPLTAFGNRYERAGLEFEPALVQAYPNLFLVDGAAPAAAGAEAAGAQAESVAVPGNEPFDAKKYYLSECKECHGKYGDGDPFQGVPAFATDKWIAERSPHTEELLKIILYGKDKMIGQAGKITEEDAVELLELIRGIAEKYK